MINQLYTALEIMKEMSEEEVKQLCILMLGMKAQEFGAEKSIEYLSKI